MTEEKGQAGAPVCPSKRRMKKSREALRSAADDAAGVQICTGVVALMQGADDNAAAGAGMNELTAAQIDPHMADAAAAGVEEHQIAGGALRRGNGGAEGILAGGAVGQRDAELGEHLHGEAGAVDALVAGAAVAVGGAQIGVLLSQKAVAVVVDSATAEKPKKAAKKEEAAEGEEKKPAKKTTKKAEAAGGEEKPKKAPAKKDAKKEAEKEAE